MTPAWRHKLTLCPWVLCHHAASLPFRCGLACCRSVALERLTSGTWQVPGQRLPHGARTNGSTEQRARQFTRNLSNQAPGSKPENRQGNPAEHELSELQDL